MIARIWFGPLLASVLLALTASQRAFSQRPSPREPVVGEHVQPHVRAKVSISTPAWSVDRQPAARAAPHPGQAEHLLLAVESRPAPVHALRHQGLLRREYPAAFVEGADRFQLPPHLSGSIIEIEGSAVDVQAELERIGIAPAQAKAAIKSASSSGVIKASSEDEVVTLVQSGPSANRIDLVFMGDGYTAAERELFFEDARRLSSDLFEAQTFASYLPIFNVHAVFRPSAVTGIGKGRAVDTAYGLYREGDTLRAIFPGKPDALRKSCAAAPDCDYPVVVANDDRYGGLGGEFAITTRSPTSGTIVLRHELGHNFGKVGEEYDGGGYFGRNHSASLRNIGWKDWLSNGPARPKASPSRALALQWPWQKIATTPFVIPFQSNRGAPFSAIRMSLSGVEGSGGYALTFNGVPLPVPEIQTQDRSFISVTLPGGLTPGGHELVVSSNGSNPDAYLSSFTIHETDFDPALEQETIGAYPVHTPDLRVAGYRPTNESCLMRDMLHPWFCPVCQENNWRELLGRIKLVDNYEVKADPMDSGFDLVRLEVVPLGQFRSLGESRWGGEMITIKWRLGGQELPEAADKTEVRVPVTSRSLVLQADVAFLTPEIRLDETGYANQKIVIERPRGIGR